VAGQGAEVGEALVEIGQAHGARMLTPARGVAKVG
jgi:hypothetical protein